MRKTLYGIVSVIAIIIVSGCATPTVVQREKPGDKKLSCSEIEKEIAEADRFEREARGERKVTDKNVAAAILFWPALAATYVNTGEAIDAAKERRSHLLELHKKKRC